MSAASDRPEGEVRAQVVVVTGLSGAGKTIALNALEDAGYYCVDNLPPELASATLRVCEAAGIERVALGMDVRVGGFLDRALDAIRRLARDRPAPLRAEVLFLEASDEVLVRRFSETRRPHPILAEADDADGRLAVADGVHIERERMAPIRAVATLVVDTSHRSVHELRREVLEHFSGAQDHGPRMVSRIVSFGYKYGLPLDADVVFDVRFLDNPFFVPELRDRPGTHPEVRDFVLRSPGCGELCDRLEGLLAFALPGYEREGKAYLTVAIGCTGGRHRSVAIAAELAQRLSRRSGQKVGIVHRDLSRGGMIREVAAAGGAEGEGASPKGEGGKA